MLYDFTEARAELASRDGADIRWSPGLPVQRELCLRPTIDLCRRLGAIWAMATWICANEDQAPWAPIGDWIESQGVIDHLSDRTRRWLDQPRDLARQEHIGRVGWLFEGAWSLAWLLGFEPGPPTPLAPMMGDELVVNVLRFAPSPHSVPELEPWAAQRRVRSQDRVATLEDTFYCFHNAVRSASLGAPGCIPEHLDLPTTLGLVQQRRRALTWALSPGVRWQDTDLST